MVIATVGKTAAKQIAKKKSRPSTGGASDGRLVNAPESELAEFEILDNPESYLSDLQEPDLPLDGFYIGESDARLAKERALSERTKFDVNRLKYLIKFYEQQQKKSRRGYTAEIARLAEFANTQPKLLDKATPPTPVLTFPDLPTATQPDPELTDISTTLDEPGFDVPKDPPPEDPDENRKEKFKTCEELEEEIRDYTGMEISFCPRTGTGQDIRISVTNHGTPRRKTIQLPQNRRQGHGGRQK